MLICRGVHMLAQSLPIKKGNRKRRKEFSWFLLGIEKFVLLKKKKISVRAFWYCSLSMLSCLLTFHHCRLLSFSQLFCFLYCSYTTGITQSLCMCIRMAFNMSLLLSLFISIFTALCFLSYFEIYLYLLTGIQQHSLCLGGDPKLIHHHWRKWWWFDQGLEGTYCCSKEDCRFTSGTSRSKGDIVVIVMIHLSFF